MAHEQRTGVAKQPKDSKSLPYVEGLLESWQDNEPKSYRRIIFVRYPSTMTAREMAEKLEWAKWFSVERLWHDYTTVKCGVKPPYVKHFLKDNIEYRIPHNALFTDGGVIYDVEYGGTDLLTERPDTKNRQAEAQP